MFRTSRRSWRSRRGRVPSSQGGRVGRSSAKASSRSSSSPRAGISDQASSRGRRGNGHAEDPAGTGRPARDHAAEVESRRSVRRASRRVGCTARAAAGTTTVAGAVPARPGPARLYGLSMTQATRPSTYAPTHDVDGLRERSFVAVVPGCSACRSPSRPRTRRLRSCAGSPATCASPWTEATGRSHGAPPHRWSRAFDYRRGMTETRKCTATRIVDRRGGEVEKLGADLRLRSAVEAWAARSHLLRSLTRCLSGQ